LQNNIARGLTNKLCQWKHGFNTFVFVMATPHLEQADVVADGGGVVVLVGQDLGHIHSLLRTLVHVQLKPIR